jgi:hypothetical protein
MVILLQVHITWESGGKGKSIHWSEEFSKGFQLQAVLRIGGVLDSSCCWVCWIPSSAHCRHLAQETQW